MTLPQETSVHAIGRRVLRGVFTVLFFYLFLKLGGFLLYLLLPWYFGTGRITDAFTAVYGIAIHLLLYSTAIKVLLPVFMPLFAERMETGDEDAAWDVLNTSLNIALIAGLIAGAFMMVFAPGVISILFPSFDAETQRTCVLLLRWMAPAIPLMFFAAVAQGILNSYKVFSFPSAGEAAQKLTWVAAIFIGMLAVKRIGDVEVHGPYILGLSFLVGCTIQSGILLYGLRGWLRRYRPAIPALTGGRFAAEFPWLVALAAAAAAAVIYLARTADPGERSFWTISALIALGCLYAASLWLRTRRGTGLFDRMAFLAAPLMVGILFARYRDLALASFQSQTESGGFTLIEMAKRVANLPNILIGYTLAVVIFPFLCDLAARRDREQLARVAKGSIRMLAAALLPMTAVTIAMSAPVMRLLFDHGKWGPQEIHQAGLALAVLSGTIFFLGIENVLMQTFFSLQKTLLPSVLGIIFSILPSLALYVAIEKMGYAEHAFILVCAAWTVSRALKNIFLLGFAQAHVRLFTLNEAVPFTLKIAALCAAPAAAAWGTHRWISSFLPLTQYAQTRLRFEAMKCVHVAVPSLAALVAFVVLCIVLRLEEFQLAVNWVREKGWRRRDAAAAQTPLQE
jgi:peptidoglycan biosynthesis protein MviN/MurJ (putative lipid II flippase)